MIGHWISTCRDGAIAFQVTLKQNIDWDFRRPVSSLSTRLHLVVHVYFFRNMDILQKFPHFSEMLSKLENLVTYPSKNCSKRHVFTQIGFWVKLSPDSPLEPFWGVARWIFRFLIVFSKKYRKICTTPILFETEVRLECSNQEHQISVYIFFECNQNCDDMLRSSDLQIPMHLFLKTWIADTKRVGDFCKFHDFRSWRIPNLSTKFLNDFGLFLLITKSRTCANYSARGLRKM